MKFLWYRLIFMVVLLGGIFLLWYSGLIQNFSFDALKKNHHQIAHWVETHQTKSAIFFVLTYIFIAGLSIPGATILTILSGFIFPQPQSTFLVMIGATIGAMCLFQLTQRVFMPALDKDELPSLEKMREGFNKDSKNYLISLRLIPFFPFWLVNMGAAILQVPFFTFVWTTFFGIIPVTFAYTEAGKALDNILKSSDRLTVSSVLNTDTQIALLFFAGLALLPILYRRYRN